MGITIDGTTGITNVDGSAANPAYKQQDSNTGLSGSADQLVLSTAGTERLRVASAGQLGIAGANYGTDGQVLTSTGASSAPAWEDAGGGLFSAWAHVFELQSGGTEGGTFTNGAMRTRVLNGESDPSNIVSLSSNQFTLGAGSYIIRWSAPAYRTNQHVSELYDATNTTVEARGTQAYSESGGDYAETRSIGKARVSPSGDTAYEIRHQGGVTRNSDGFGTGMGGQYYIFTSVEIMKEA